MSSVQNIGGNQPVQRVIPQAVHKPATLGANAPTRGADQLELSGVGHLLKSLKAGGDVRAEKVAQIKAQIDAGTYEDDKKLDVASSRLLDELLK